MTEDIRELHIAEQLYKKTWKELCLVEFNDRVLLPEKIYRRKADGSVEGIPILIQVPREPDTRKARLKSRELALGEGLDLERDKDLIEQLETLSLLSICLRNTTEPHEPWEPDVKTLENKYDLNSLSAVYAKMDAFAAMINPQPSELSETDCWALVGAMATARNILPLHVYAPDSLNFFVIFMADQLVNSPAYKSYLESQEALMQESSTPEGSKKS